MTETRAFHDLNGVTTINIQGWKGPRQILPQPPGEHAVTVSAPQRHEGEFWTFSRPRDGKLTCFTSLLGSPPLLTESSVPLTVRLPADRIAGIAVTFDGEPEPASPRTPSYVPVVQRTELTGETEDSRYAEITTPAGLIRVNTGLVNVRTGQPAVTVEVLHNLGVRARTPQGGHWDVTVDDHLGSWTEVKLTRQQEGAGQ